MTQKIRITLLLALSCWLIGIVPNNAGAKQAWRTLKILQFNIWQEGTMVEGGFEGIVEEILKSDSEIVLLSEVRNYQNKDFIVRLIEVLRERGVSYYGKNERQVDVSILSKFPIIEQQIVYRTEDSGNILKAKIKIGEQHVVVYSAHLDYKHYACYLPRGYDGSTWKKLPEPITNTESIVAMGRKSNRNNAIQVAIEDMLNEKANDNLIFIGGDFNEPSHLDWQEDTKNLWDHNGCVINWDCSKQLYQNGFKDAYREIYPNTKTHPGFTFPSDNKDTEATKLTWAPDADERERIDFIYYMPHTRIQLKDAAVVGPAKSIVRGQRVKETSEDKFIIPSGIWPTDHKAVLCTFLIKL